MSDFQEYWSALQIALAGGNSYSALAMKEFQLSHFGAQIPIMMWNPPWLLLLLFPILILPATASSMTWQICSLLCFVACSFYWIKTTQPNQESILKNRPLITTASLICFAPAWCCLHWGQVSLFLLLGVTLFCAAFRQNNTTGTFIGAALCSLKPHLFGLFFIPFVFLFYQQGRWRQLVSIALLFFALLIATEICFSGQIQNWIEACSRTTRELPELPLIQEWAGASLLGAIRILFNVRNGYELNLFIYTLIAITLAYLSYRHLPKFSYSQVLPWLIAFSVYLTPFGWYFDQVLFLPLYIRGINLCLNSARILWLEITTLVGLQLVSIVFLFFVIDFHHQISWYGLTLLVLMFHIERAHFKLYPTKLSNNSNSR